MKLFFTSCFQLSQSIFFPTCLVYTVVHLMLSNVLEKSRTFSDLLSVGVSLCFRKGGLCCLPWMVVGKSCHRQGPLFFFSLVYIKIGNFKLGNFASFDFLTPPPHFKTVTYVFSILLCQWALNKRRTEVFSLNITCRMLWLYDL